MPEPTWPFDPPPTARLGPDVVCLGNALVDRLVMASEDAVAAARLEAGAMTLVDGKRAEEIEASCSGWHEVAGGSAANTAAGIASLGGRALFAGAVGDDPAGRRYAADLEKSGVRCITPAARSGHPTGVCHVFVSEGGARTMATSLGAAGELSLEAVELAEIESAAVLYVEGYLLDAPPAAAALDSALEIARKSGTLVSLSLSDPFVVERHRDKIAELVASGRVDLVLGNEAEALSLTGASGLDEATAALLRPELALVITRGARGSLLATSSGTTGQQALPIGSLVDTTGAGDLFAAGVLRGLTNSATPAQALWLGSLAAAEVIQHVGARPEASLSELARTSAP